MGIGTTSHIENIRICTFQAGRWTQHRNHAVQTLILAVRGIVQSKILSLCHVEAIVYLVSIGYHVGQLPPYTLVKV